MDFDMTSTVMKTRFGIVTILLAMLLLPTQGNTTKAENVTKGSVVPPPEMPSSVTVKTDKQVYSQGETIMISGKVAEIQVGKPVLIQIYDPSEAPYRSVEVNLASDGSYGYALSIEDNHGISGGYTVKATYELNYPRNSVEVSFLYLVPYILTISDRTYPINYTISYGRLINIATDVAGKSLTVRVNATGPGTLTITLPRSVIDAVENNLDAAFTVLIDHSHEQFNFREIQTRGNARTLEIFFTFVDEPYSVLDINIVGTKIIPEFPVSSVVLSTSILGPIFVSRLIRKSYYGRGV